jgi:para-nitrobenzyl esterase
MVWIHGGAFITGEGWDYDGTALVNTGNVIIVTLNYRLGLLGFMAHPALVGANGQVGNYGLLDQQAAIAWVRQNIKNFGGNPNAVTIFGESADGQSIIDNLVSTTLPAVHTAISESGDYAAAIPTLSAAEADAESRMASLGCTSQTAACLRSLTVAQLLSAVNPLTDLGKISPVVDGEVIPEQPWQALAAGKFQRVPVINGSNHDEYRLFVILALVLGAPPYTPQTYAAAVDAQFGSTIGPEALALYPPSFDGGPNYAYAAVITDSGFACGAHLVNSLLSQYVPVYSYELNDPNAPDLFLPYEPEMPNAGDSHAAELPYLWPLLQSSLFGKGVADFTPAQQNLALGMRSSWTSFAKYGRPLNPRGVSWAPFTIAGDNLLSLIPPAAPNYNGFVANHNCDFWIPLLLQQAGLPANTKY